MCVHVCIIYIYIHIYVRVFMYRLILCTVGCGIITRQPAAELHWDIDVGVYINPPTRLL